MIYLQIREILEKRGKSKYWLTNQMQKSHHSITNLMKEDLTGIHFDTLEKLCNILGVTPRRINCSKRRSRKGE